MAAVLTPDQFTRITQLAPKPQTAPEVRRLNLATSGLQPQTDYWVTPDDYIVLGIRNALIGAQVQVACRLWLPDGTFAMPQFKVSPPSDRTLNYTSQQLYYGFLVSACATAVGVTLPLRGQTYATLQLVRPPLSAFLNDQAQASGYLTAANFLSWPWGRVQDAVEGPGTFYSLGLSTPAAGSEFAAPIFSGARWRFGSLTCKLTASAAVGTRVPNLGVDDGTNTFFIAPSGTSVAAGGSATVDYVVGYPVLNSQSPDFIAPLPGGLTLPAGGRLRSVTPGLQAGDQYSAIRLLVEEVLED